MTEIETHPTVTDTDAAPAATAENTTPDLSTEESVEQTDSPTTDDAIVSGMEESDVMAKIRALADEDPEEGAEEPADDAGDEAGSEEQDPDAPAKEGDAKEDDPDGASKIPGLEAELKKLSPNMAKRVETLFKEVPTLKAENARMAEELEKVQGLPATLPRTVADPLSDIRTEEELNTALAYARDVKRFAKKNPDGGTFNGKEVDYDQLQIMDDWADAAIMQADERRKYLEGYAGATAFAKQILPDVLNPKTPLGAALERWVKTAPGVVQNPAYVGDFVCMARGAAIIQAEKEGYRWIKVKPGSAEEKAALAKTPRRATANTTATVPVRAATGRPVSDSSLARRLETGDEDAIRQRLREMVG